MILHRHARRDHQFQRLFRRAVDVDAAAAQLFQRGADGFVARERPRSGAGFVDDAPDVLGTRVVKRSIESLATTLPETTSPSVRQYPGRQVNPDVAALIRAPS
jgi:hypothetical protein